MVIVFGVILKILLMILLGFGIKRAGLLPDAVEQGLGKLLTTVILPISIIASGNVQLTAELASGLRITAFLTAGYYIFSILILLVLVRLAKFEHKMATIFLVLGVFANTAYLGFPLTQAFYGAEGTLYCTIYNTGFQLMFFSWGLYMLRGGGKFSLRIMLKTPVMLASLFTLLLVLTPFQLPGFLQETISAVGAMTTPISMMIIGASFTRMKLKDLLTDKWCYTISALRLVIFPAIMLAVVTLLRLPPVPSACCVLMTALPCGSIGALYADQLDYHPKFAARAVVQSTLLMIVTCPILLYILSMIYG